MVPIIDISECSSSGEARRAIARRIDRACRDVGFFYVRGHGVDERVISSLQAAVVELFELPWPVKQALSVEPGNYRGYIPYAAFGDNVSVVDVDHYEVTSCTARSPRTIPSARSAGCTHRIGARGPAAFS